MSCLSEFEASKGKITPVLHDELASLDGVKTSGDKLALLDSLMINGKLDTTPLKGPQSLIAEASVGPAELIRHAVEGAHTVKVEAAQALPHDEKVSLVQRVISDKPTITTKEITAICKVLDVDPKPFVDKKIESTVKDLHTALGQDRSIKQFRNVTLSLLYEDKVTVDRIADRFEKTYNKNLRAQAKSTFKDPSIYFALDIALLGSHDSPMMDLERVMTLFRYEKSLHKKYAGLFYTAEYVKLQQAEDAVRRIKSQLAQKLKDGVISDGDYQAFLNDAVDAWKKYATDKKDSTSNAATFRAAFIFLLLAVAVLVIQTKQDASRYWIGTVAFSLLVYATGMRRERIFQINLSKRLKEPFLTESEKLAYQKSALKKSLFPK